MFLRLKCWQQQHPVVSIVPAMATLGCTTHIESFLLAKASTLVTDKCCCHWYFHPHTLPMYMRLYQFIIQRLQRHLRQRISIGYRNALYGFSGGDLARKTIDCQWPSLGWERKKRIISTITTYFHRHLISIIDCSSSFLFLVIMPKEPREVHLMWQKFSSTVHRQENAVFQFVYFSLVKT